MDKRHKSISQVKAGALLSYVSMLLSNGIALVYTPVMLRFLGQSEYGIYSLAGSAVSYLGILSFGFDSAYVRFFSRYKVQNDEKKISRLNGMFFTVFAFISVLTLAFGAVLTSCCGMFFSEKLSATELSRTKILMAVLIVNLAISFICTVFKAFITANERFLIQRLVNILRTVTNPLVMLPLLFLGFRSVAMVAVSTTLNIICDVVYIIYCRKRLNIRFVFHKCDSGFFREIFVFSFFIFINMIVDRINWSVDKFLLGIYRGAVSVAVYALAAQLNTYYMTISMNVSSVLVPRINRMAANDDGNGLSRLFKRVGRLQFFILSLVLTLIIFFGKPFITMWAGENYAQAYPILLLLVIPVTVPLVQTVAMEIQRAMNLHSFRAYIYLGIAILNVSISIPLCIRFGAVGCAVGTAAALLVGNGIIMNIFYYKKMGLDVPGFWLEILKIVPSLLIPCAAGILMMRFINLYNLKNFVLSAVLYMTAFLISVFFFGMNKSEKDMVLKHKIFCRR